MIEPPMRQRMRDGIGSALTQAELASIEALLRHGVLVEPGTGRRFFTGYSYGTLYDWDQYFDTIVQLYAGWDGTLGRNAVLMFLDRIRDTDGFIARDIPISTDFPEEGAEHVKPFLCQIAWLLHRWGDDLAWIDDRCYARLRHYLLYWLDCRDGDGNGLPTWRSAPHTGMDTHRERAGLWCSDYCEGVDLQCYLYRECQALAAIARYIGKPDDAAVFEARALRLAQAVQQFLWHEADGFFYDRHEGTGTPIKVKSISGFAPLWAGIATAEQAERLVAEHLRNPLEFWRPFPLPGYAASEPSYSATHLPGDVGCNWRANTWVPTNYYVFQGLRRYGFEDLAREIAVTTSTVVRDVGPREYYDTESVTGAGLDPFWGWTLLAYFMPVEHALGIDPTRLDMDT